MDAHSLSFSADERYFIDNLDRAISEEWIKAYHQPLIRAASGKVSDEEAFARWEDPDKGTFKAGDFIPVLEKAKLTYKLDLYMIDRVLNKMRGQAEHGLFVVPESVNLSRSDFYSCDMVTEVIKRIDASGLSRDKLSIELSERVISSDVSFMRSRIDRFRNEGIKVWMDDYGSGYSSLLILLEAKFNLLKIDKALIDLIGKSESGQIILTELIKTAVALGIETAAEGVETKEQADFLKEIGCTKLQGYYFIEPVSLATIIERNKKGIQIGFENPAESDYYEKLGKVNLYDLSVSKNDDISLNNYFDTLPMSIWAVGEKDTELVRSNRTFREFVFTNFKTPSEGKIIKIDSIKPGQGYYSFNAVIQCAKDGKRKIIDDRLPDGRIMQLFLKRIAQNPVTGVSAVAVTILSISEKASSEAMNYNYIARALSEDYIDLYYVNMDTDEYTKYSPDGASRDISVEDHGTDFFNLDREDFPLNMLPEDKEQLKKDFKKKKIAQVLKKSGVYSVVTKIVLDKKPIYVTMKCVQVRGEGNFIIVGINNTDAQTKAREALTAMKEEKLIYSRIGALTGDYIYIFTVNPKTMHYTRYNPSNVVSNMDLSSEGDNFFESILQRADKGIYSEDLEQFISSFNKENVFSQIEKMGVYENKHRLNIGKETRYVLMRATLLNEDGESKLIVGILDIDERVKKEQLYEESLTVAEIKANIDELTGVKNKHAYADAEAKMNEQINNKMASPFAVAVFDINGLKQVNDTLGHQAGDEYIKKGCNTICRFFKHSPVYRVGGDEFAVLVTGYDYLNIDSIINRFKKHIIKNKLKGDVVVAAGISSYDSDSSVAEIFTRADEAMYRNKKELKSHDVPA